MNINTANDFTHFQKGIRENMRQALSNAKISQQQLAERLGTSKSYVSKVLHGKKGLSLNFLWKFANEVCSGDLYSLLPESPMKRSGPVLQYADQLLRRIRRTNCNESFKDFEEEIRNRIRDLLQSENKTRGKLAQQLAYSYHQIQRHLSKSTPTHFTLEFLYEFVESTPPVTWSFLLQGTIQELYAREQLFVMCNKLTRFEQEHLLSQLTPLLGDLITSPYRAEGFAICKTIFSICG